jgi:DNA-binding IclR family transcriptional regulator
LPRPALSASRSIDVIDLLAGVPTRGFTLSEISSAAGINLASCHAILNELTARGYLVRCPKRQVYTLGAALTAVGNAAIKAQPLVAKAEEAAIQLSHQLGVSTLVSALAGEDVVGVISIPDAQGQDAGMHAGQRIPARPPGGAPFMAWAPEEAVERWIGAAPPDFAEAWRGALASIRKHGFHVAMRGEEDTELATLMAEMAAGSEDLANREKLVDLLRSISRFPTQPEEIIPDARYDVALIAAPIFQENGEAILNLCIGGFSGKLSGDEVLRYSRRLVLTCLEVMRSHRRGN